QRLRTTSNIHSKRLPREWLLEDALAEIPGEKQSVRPIAAKRSEKPQLSDADVLRLVHNRGIVGRRSTFRLGVGQGLKHCGLCHQAARFQSLADLLEDLPQNGSPRFGSPRARA